MEMAKDIELTIVARFKEGFEPEEEEIREWVEYQWYGTLVEVEIEEV
jgi:hypothetical protein